MLLLSRFLVLIRSMKDAYFHHSCNFVRPLIFFFFAPISNFEKSFNARKQCRVCTFFLTVSFLKMLTQGQGSLVGCRLWGRTELDTSEVT